MIRKTMELSGRTLTLETGRMAKQASGSILLTYGETVLLATATANKEAGEDRGFMPLSVEYREKFYAAGRIPGGFFKREARPSEKEIIACRLTDRPLRPLFPKGFHAETQIAINVLSYDEENPGDTLGTIAASAALAISDIPWGGPVATVRVGRIDGKFIINPEISKADESDMEIIVSGTSDSVVMVEGEADFISEEDFLSAIQYGFEAIKDIIKLQEELVSECGIAKRVVVEPEVNVTLNEAIDKFIDGKIPPLNDPKVKFDRYEDIRSFKSGIIEEMGDDYADNEKAISSYIDAQITADLRKRTLAGTRADGRNLTTVRDIAIDTALLPRVHGSSLFTRGETQALATITLGGKRDEQMLDNIEGLTFKRNMLHYNFPSFCVGEARMRFSLSRREVGHGNLAERAIRGVLPTFDDFPYTIRIVSEVLESNGSSSMATVCGGIIALMDAGVPIKDPVAGVAMGLVMEDEDNYAILTDILGTEDHLGDMDFKVAGTRDGITAIQMDLKIDGLPIELMKKALNQAKDARLHLLDEMEKAMPSVRPELSVHAPKIGKASLPVDRIGDFIGPGGKNIKAVQADYECDVNVEEDGLCVILGQDQEKIDYVVSLINSYNMKPEPGETYDGEVVKIMDFGCFVKIAPGKDGLVHISELNWNRVEKVTDVVKEGEMVKVKLLEIDDRGRLKLSMKALMERPPRDSKPENSHS
jgi:polyribonucleotide nucleotidyltransferase